MNLIDVKNLLFNYKIYSGEKEEVIEHTAIDHVSLSIKKGDFVGILGHNGSGKSTLAKQLAALLKPSGGIIYVNGMDTAKDELLLPIRKTAGMVFQNPDNQLIGNIVEEDIAFGPENMGIPREEVEERIREHRSYGNECISGTFSECTFRWTKTKNRDIRGAFDGTGMYYF